MRILAFMVALLLAPLTVSSAVAGDDILTVTRADGSQKTYTMEALEALGTRDFTTSTSWTDGPVAFTGVAIADILADAGIETPQFAVSAVNDYKATIELAEVRRYPVILATRMNGERMSLREKGPLWVVYPRDEYPELMPESHNFKWVWQVNRLAAE